MDLTLTQQQLPGVTVIGVRGELDLLTCEQLEERLAQVRRPGDQLIIDLARTTFIDCSGLRTLMHANDRVRQGGGVLCLAAPQPRTVKIIRLADLDTVLAVYPSLRRAIGAAFNEQASPGVQAHGS